MEQVILVNEEDKDIGAMEKLEAHQKGVLHRAFSVVLYNNEGKILLQQRAHGKYHSGGLWTNTCCSHPRPQEQTPDAAQRRLMEEMGIRVPLDFQYKFIYKVQLGSLIEHEMDHVFTGVFNGSPNINPDEVSDWKFMTPGEILSDIALNPDQYSAWFRMIMQRLPQQ